MCDTLWRETHDRRSNSKSSSSRKSPSRGCAFYAGMKKSVMNVPYYFISNKHEKGKFKVSLETYLNAQSFYIFMNFHVRK
jgi:hypothetical protein